MLAGVGLSVRELGILGERVNEEGRGDEVGGDMGRLETEEGAKAEPRGEPDEAEGSPEIEPLLRKAELREDGGELGGEKVSPGEL